MGTAGNLFCPSLCVTHDCNLSCIYCYQKHNPGLRMDLEMGKKLIDWIFNNIPSSTNEVEISFIGGEPLLEFDVMKNIFEYTLSKDINYNYIFFASTNGTVLTNEMKNWFSFNKDRFCLGLSLDGRKDTHDYNRSNSFDDIDIGFFINNWPDQAVKMTLSEYSLPNLAKDIKYMHSLGFKDIGGVNLFEGAFDWTDEKYIRILATQLRELVDFYVDNSSLHVNQMLNISLDICEEQPKQSHKWCGIGERTIFFDIDGKKYPCNFLTPMTFSKKELDDVIKIDFANKCNFTDEECYSNCYIHPICPTCSGANYLVNRTFKIRNKSKCKIQKLIVLFAADLQTKRILNDNTIIQDKNILYYTIEAIKKIRGLYLDELKIYL
jgi:sulfatase maturation enzyme AslB (radical SAM superfamily)